MDKSSGGGLGIGHLPIPTNLLNNRGRLGRVRAAKSKPHKEARSVLLLDTRLTHSQPDVEQEQLSVLDYNKEIDFNRAALAQQIFTTSRCLLNIIRKNGLPERMRYLLKHFFHRKYANYAFKMRVILKY